MKLIADTSGQAQILMAVAVGATVLAGAMFMLDHSAQTTNQRVKNIKNIELVNVLNAAAQTAQQLYRDSSCDPGVFNAKLNRMKSDGTLMPTLDAQPSLSSDPNFPTRRQADVTVGARTYNVSYGRVYLPGGGALPATGTSQDAEVIISVSANGQRVDQTIVLLNNCTYPCGYTDSSAASGTCSANPPPAAGSSYHRMVTATDASYPCPTVGDVYRVDSADEINVNDLIVLRNYIRSGTVPAGVTDIQTCGDLNQDKLVNETDLGLLEKYLRGYVYKLPVR